MDSPKTAPNGPLPTTEAEWKKRLNPEEYYVLRQKGTEAPFKGEYTDEFGEGQYVCRACGTPLFESGEKFHSACGWPAFKSTQHPDAINEHRDTSHGMVRTEVTCKTCGSHLGHVFDDGPPPTGLRYCINSISVTFKSKASG